LTKKAFKDQTLSERKQSKFLVFKVMIKTGMAGFLIIFGGCSWMQTWSDLLLTADTCPSGNDASAVTPGRPDPKESSQERE
jgi:hypothetical protein